MQTDLYKYSTEPYTHQIEATKFVADGRMDYFALFCEQGTGKTKMTIDIAENMFLDHRINRVLILAPNGVHRQWINSEIPLHGFVPSSRVAWQSSKKCRDQVTSWMAKPHDEELMYLAVNTEAFSVTSYLDLFKKYVDTGKTMVVIDEATSIGNPDSNRTTNIIFGLNDTIYNNRHKPVSTTPTSVCRVVLTGTPEAKGPYKLWSMFTFLSPEFWGMGYYAFRARYGMERSVFYPGATKPTRKPLDFADFAKIRSLLAKGDSVQQIAMTLAMNEHDVQYIADNPGVNTPYKNLAELKAKVATRAFVITKAQCLDLPPKVYSTELVPMSEEQKKLYKEMQREAWAVYQQGALDAKNKAGIRTRLRQIAGGFFPTKYTLEDGNAVQLAEMASTPIGKVPPKAARVLDKLEDDATFPIIISTAFTAEAEFLYAQCVAKGYATGLIVGRVPTQQRKLTEEQFKAGELQVLVATEQTIAKGYNFQRSHEMYLYSCTYNSEDRMQLEDRIHRIGQTETVSYTDFVTENSVDASVLAVLKGDVEFQRFMQSSDPADFFKEIGHELWQ